MEHLSLFDLVTLLLVFFLGIKGILRGFIKEVFGLVGIIGGIYVASRYAALTGHFADSWFLHLKNKETLYLIGFVTTFVLFWLASLLLGNIVTKLISLSGLGFVDKLLGFAVGAAKVFLIIGVIVFVLSNISILHEKVAALTKNSFMYPLFYRVGSKIVDLDKAGPDFGSKIRSTLSEATPLPATAEEGE